MRGGIFPYADGESPGRRSLAVVHKNLLYHLTKVRHLKSDKLFHIPPHTASPPWMSGLGVVMGHFPSPSRCGFLYVLAKYTHLLSAAKIVS